MSLRSRIKRITPWPLHYLYRKLYYSPQDVPAAFGFIFHGTRSKTSFVDRVIFVFQCYKISYFVDCPHTEHEIMVIARRILNLGAEVPGAIVEAGSFHGGSTAKLSLVAKLCDRALEVFDSFAGMPENTEAHGKSIYGREHHFPKGSHAVPFEEVRTNVARFGDGNRTQFHKGFFNETMPNFHDPVAAACVNVDLVQSTKDCLHYLYPLLSRGGIFFSQDAHFPWIIELLNDDAYWKNEFGIAKPDMPGLGRLKFVSFTK
ncbi:MAG TPA: TylF/MycF/NovP-related O-methyltransferase [Candidatus Paceibacterota bacterium]|nr:TylF/MycF/NovP-related O-methyltransferase [Candidatus Paceibacterota bacterium]